MLKRFLTAWIIGTFCVFAIGVSVALVVPLVALEAGWAPFSFTIGPLELFQYTSGDSTLFAIEFGSDLFIFSLLAGMLNGLGAVFFASRFSPINRDLR